MSAAQRASLPLLALALGSRARRHVEVLGLTAFSSGAREVTTNVVSVLFSKNASNWASALSSCEIRLLQKQGQTWRNVLLNNGGARRE